MPSTPLTDLIAQASVDSEFEARLVACTGHLDDFLEFANSSGYSLSREALAVMSDLSDQELASVVGGGHGGDGGTGGKGAIALIALIKNFQKEGF